MTDEAPRPTEPQSSQRRRFGKRWLFGVVGIGVILSGVFMYDAVIANPAAAAIRSGSIITRDNPSFFNIEPNVTQITFTLLGASGQSGQSGFPNVHGGSPGAGGQISATVTMGHGIRVGDQIELIPGVTGGSSPKGQPVPMSGGPGGSGTPNEGNYGGYGGGGSGVLNVTTGQWLLIAGGGGGGGGPGSYEYDGPSGGAANQPGQSARSATGGSVGGNCPETGANTPAMDGGPGQPSGTALFNGGGGGGGGGCYGGNGGAAGQFGGAGGGGAGGRTWNFAAATNISRELAPIGQGSVEATISLYTEPKPVILSPDHFNLTVGQPVFADFVSEGKPPPELLVSGTFPPGVTFHVPAFSGKGEIRGTPATGSQGNYKVTITARNDQGSVTQTIDLIVK